MRYFNQCFNCKVVFETVEGFMIYYKFQFQMKSRHSIEIKGLLEHKKMGQSRQNVQSSTNLTTYSVNKTKNLKHSESSSTLRRTDTSISIIEDRYRTLERNYKQLLQQTRLKGQLFRQQKEELQRYRQIHQRDQKEIMQLRTLLQLTRKNQNCPSPNIQRSIMHNSVGRPQKHCSSVPKQRRSPLINKSNQLNTPLANSNVGALKKNSRIRFEAEGKQTFSKYKFVPTLPLK